MQSSTADLLEVRIHGLNISITTDALGEFLGKGVRLRGILLHPPSKGWSQWAQVWVSTEAEVISLLGLRDALAVNGIVTPPQTSWDLVSQLSKLTRPSSAGLGLSSAPSLTSSALSRAHDAVAALPRNLYILNLPLDLTQIEFKDLFAVCGMVEHSILLSQLDGIGRRRGFVLMASHREALEVMHQMHGKWIDGFKLDISWALVQRETKNMPSSTMPNRVVHPPAIPTRRDASPDCAVIVDNLDSNLFPDTDTISTIFRSFGPVIRVVKLSETPLSVLIQFEHAVSAQALVNANGLRLGDRVLSTRALVPGTTSNDNQNGFDPFAEAPWHNWLDEMKQQRRHSPRPGTPQSMASRVTRLNADSQPFVPGYKPKSPTPYASSNMSSRLGGGHFMGCDRSELSASWHSAKSRSPSDVSASKAPSRGESAPRDV